MFGKSRLLGSVAAGVVAAGAMMGAASPAAAGNFLIVKDSMLVSGDRDAVSGLATTMRELGHTVTVQMGVPSSVTGYDQVWDLRINDYSTSIASTYKSYLEGGGVLIAVGEHSGFSSRNSAIIRGVQEIGGGTLEFTTPNNVQSVQLYGEGVPASVDFNASGNYDGGSAFGGSSTADHGFFVTKDANGNGTIIAFDPGTLKYASAGAGVVIFDINMFDRTDPELTALVNSIIRYLTGDLTQERSAALAQDTQSAQDQVVVRTLGRMFGNRLATLRKPGGGFSQSQLTRGFSEDESETGFSAGDAQGWDLTGLGLWADISRSGTEGSYANTVTEGSTYVFTVGADYVFRPDLVGGLALSYENSSSEFSNGGESDSDAYQASLYGAYQPLDWMMAQAFVGYGFGDNSLNDRQLGNMVKGDYDSRRFMSSLGVRAFHTVEFADPVSSAQHGVEFSGGLSHNYSISYLDDYTASNNRRVDQGSVVLSQAVASVEATYLSEVIQPYVGFAYEYDFINSSDDDTGGFVNVGARISVGDNSVATVEYGSEILRDKSEEHAISASFRYAF